jgi:activator of 2-hydroxyglutaryl-CoA dehydratase
VTAEASQVNPRTEAVAIGIDVGSTTVKAVVVDPITKEILWSDYLRHQTKQAEFVLVVPGADRGGVPQHPAGADPHLHHRLGRLADRPAHRSQVRPGGERRDAGGRDAAPGRRSVCELGGQDAKIIIFKKNEETGGKTAITSMNDKCASGTGATIDKCVIKVGLPNEEVVQIGFDDSKLHHVAAKCGVFAETDIVNLVKNGIPSLEIMNSLADAIVMQNLSVLTRGNTLRHKVLLLGGPNTYLPFLRDCWRKRIPRPGAIAATPIPKDVPDR